jgi:hypothetical protein
VSFIDPIVPEPDWGTQFPSIDPDEWIEEEEEEED